MSPRLQTNFVALGRADKVGKIFVRHSFVLVTIFDFTKRLKAALKSIDLSFL